MCACANANNPQGPTLRARSLRPANEHEGGVGAWCIVGASVRPSRRHQAHTDVGGVSPRESESRINYLARAFGARVRAVPIRSREGVVARYPRRPTAASRAQVSTTARRRRSGGRPVRYRISWELTGRGARRLLRGSVGCGIGRGTGVNTYYALRSVP